MHLLEPRRLMADDGFGRTLLFAIRALLNGEAQQFWRCVGFCKSLGHPERHDMSCGGRLM
jgi:hypothetical protein